MTAIRSRDRLSRPALATLSTCLVLLAACGKEPSGKAGAKAGPGGPNPGLPAGPNVPVAGGGIDPNVQALLDEFQAKVDAAPGDALAHAELGLVREANYMWDEASADYEKALELTPADNQWRYRLAIVQRKSGDLEAGLATMREVAKSEGAQRNAAVLCRLGDMLLESNAIEEADAHFAKARDVGPMFAEPLVGLAKAKLAQEDHATAAELCEQALAMDANYGNAAYTLGLAYRALGRDDEATTMLELGMGAATRYPRDLHDERLEDYVASVGRRMARIEDLVAANNLDEAMKECMPLVQQRKTDVRVLTQLGSILIAKGDYEDALLALNQAMIVDENHYPTQIDVARALLNLQRPQDALFHANRAAELAPEVGLTHYMRGMALVQVNKIDESLEAMKLAKAKGFENVQLHMYFAQYHGDLEQFEEMKKNAELGLALAPENPVLHLYMAQAQGHLGDLAAAESALAFARERLEPENPLVKEMEGVLEQIRNQ